MRKVIYLYGVYCLCLDIDGLLDKWSRSPKGREILSKVCGTQDTKKKVIRNQIGFSIGD